ncbi:hypothetical protein O6H91_02G022600 [Diphasiastrum complanatum]|uniref:Uncharacterized protein n=1 Tax=Diphasiastrum complanatum TaxID=34168 RepID=A0ACC2EDI7_DIPCM|nr:hypothetical protein O6H91_02G022600 [Diphasiastrum complanatum]
MSSSMASWRIIAMAAVVLLLVIEAGVLVADAHEDAVEDDVNELARTKIVRCRKPKYIRCYKKKHKCPAACRKHCEMSCKLCKAICPCDKPGAVCEDPRFIGGDGIMFYFHGKKDADFCLISDSDLHINAHFIGKSRPGRQRDFTWVQSIAIMFETHRLFLGANKVAVWNDNVDQVSIAFDGTPIVLPPVIDSTWESTDQSRLNITRITDTNGITVNIPGILELTATIVPITEQESRIHGYDISTSEDCFAHLELNFRFFSLSDEVHGVLGQTYAPGFKSPVKVGATMPIMGGDSKYQTSGLLEADCAVSKFIAISEVVDESHEEDVVDDEEDDADGSDEEEQVMIKNDMPMMSCGGAEGGMVCRR